MDPDANLKEQLDLARQLIAKRDEDVPWAADTEFGGDSDKWGDEQDRSEYFEGVSEELGGLGSRLAELVLALDEWRRKGGFDPYAGTNPPAGAPLTAIRELVEYNWRDEERDYAECERNDNDQEGHIFLRLQAVDKWLEEVTE